jgi:serralysin
MGANRIAAEIDFRLANDLTADLTLRGLQPIEGSDAVRSLRALADGPLADAESDPVTASGEPIIDGLINDLKWDTTDLSYSFPTAAGQYEDPYGGDEPGDGFATFTAAQKAAVDLMLGGVSVFSALTFDKVAGGSGDLRYAESDVPGSVGASAYAYLPGDTPEAGDVWTNHTSYEAASLVVGSFAWRSLQHETGHALGLLHGHDAGNPFGALPTEYDGHEFSIMTYKSYIGDSATDGYENETYGHPQTFMMADIAALQYLYGANYGAGSNPGDTSYTWDSDTGETFIDEVGQGEPGANVIFRTVWDGGGTDVYDLSSNATGVSIDLRPGKWSTFSADQLADLDVTSSSTDRIARGNVANALLFEDDLASLIENATGGFGKDVIVGNAVANLLIGGAGKDKLSGDSGSDVLEGGAAADKITGGKGHDTLTGGAGADQLKGSGGEDVFEYLSLADCTGDLIQDLADADDTIDVSAIDAKSSKAGNNAFDLVAAFSGKEGQAILVFAAGVTELRLDVDGDATADGVVEITGDHDGFTGFVL